MSRAKTLLEFNEEAEKDMYHYMKKGADWTEVPSDLALQGTEGYSYNQNSDAGKGKFYPTGKRGSGYGSGNGETKKSGG